MKKLLLLIFIFLLSIVKVNALKIVSLGDSISSGYLLSDSDESFDNLLASTLGAELYEYSYIGMRSDDLLKDLDDNTVIKEIKTADIIIINTGANDLLDLLDYADLSSVGIEIEYGTIPKVEFTQEFITNLKNYLQDFVKNDLKPMSTVAAKDFSTTFPLIINKIKEYNLDAKIYVNNLYNPFFDISVPLLKIDLSEIEKITDDVIESFNDTIYNHDGYVIIDIYNALRNNKYLNVNPLSLSFDPHPNVDGHKKIYELYLKEMCYKVTYDNKDYYILKGDKASIKPKFKFGYSFVKWNYDLNSINDDVVLEATYRFNYLYIIVPLIVIMFIVILIKKKH